MDLLQTLVPVVGWALLHFIWQGVLIAWAVALAMVALRGARPQTRYAVCCAAMLLCAALPLAYVFTHLSSAEHGIAAASAPQLFSFGASTVAAGLPTLIGDTTFSSVEDLLRQQLPWIVGLWLAGAALMSLRLGIGLQWVAERTRADHYTHNPYWQRRLSALARRAGVETHVRLGVADRLDSPITAGCWRPIVLVPASLVTGMPPELLEALLAHELAHIKRRDYLVNLIQSAVEIVLFYHPGVWALSRRIRIEREQIADDLAVDMLGQPHQLAQALSALDRFQFDALQLAHAAHGGNLMSRIKRLLRPDVEPVSWKMAVPLFGLFTAGVVLYAQAAPQLPAAAPVAPVASAAPAGAVDAPPAPPAAPMTAVAGDAAPARPAAPADQAAPAAPAAPLALAAPPAPAAPTAPSAPASPAEAKRAPNNIAYIYRRAGTDALVVSASAKDIAGVDPLRRAVPGDFVWVRAAGKTYLIQDPALLAKAGSAWAPVDRLSAQMDEQGRQMDVHSKVMDGLGQKMDRLAADEGGADSRTIALLRSDIKRLGQRIGEVAGKAADHAGDAAAMARMQAEIAPLQRELQQRSAELGQHMAKLQMRRAPMQALGAQMGEAGKPMAALGQRMGELGRQQAAASRAAEAATRAVIDEALRSGKAVPAPSTTL